MKIILSGWIYEENSIIDKDCFWNRAKEVNEDLYLACEGNIGLMLDIGLNIFQNREDAIMFAKKQDYCFDKNSIKKINITIQS